MSNLIDYALNEFKIAKWMDENGSWQEEEERNKFDQTIDLFISKMEAKLSAVIESAIAKAMNDIINGDRIQIAMNLAMKEYFDTLNLSSNENCSPIRKVVKRKVVVVNLLASQFNEIRKDFDELFDLTLWKDGSDSYARLRSLCDSAYKIYGRIDFMRHAVDEFLTTNATSKYVRFTGGISTLKSLLETEYYKN